MRMNSKNQDRVTIDGQDIENVEEFSYLGATICKEGGQGCFVRMKKTWRSSNISRRTKLKLFKTLVVPVVLYGCETWKMNKGDNKVLDVFQNKCLRQILRIRWEENVTTGELHENADTKPLSVEVRRRRLEDDWPHPKTR